MLKNRLYYDLFENRRLPGVFAEIRYAGLENKSSEVIQTLGNLNNCSSTLKMNFVPDYLHPELKLTCRAFKSPHVEGFAIELDGVESLEGYIASHLKPRLRTSVRNNPVKLEKNHDISYQHYFGDIRKSTYDTLMEHVRVMLLSRFSELGKENERISEWGRLLPIIYPLILKKHASLFVVRDSGKPIAISVNYHLGPVFCLFIPAFDPNYSKFGLGHLLISKQLDWCLQNKYKLFDMMMGDLRYKRDWCNKIYRFNTWVVYDKTNTRSRVRAYFLHQMQLLKMFLKELGVDRWYNSMIKYHLRIRM